jgi:hypothetical protein
MRSTFEAGGAAPYPRAARPRPGRGSLVKVGGGEAASFLSGAAQRPAAHAASFPASARSYAIGLRMPSAECRRTVL